MNLTYIQPDTPLAPNVRVLTTTRCGGASREPYDSLNMANHVDDNQQHVTMNQEVVAADLGVSVDLNPLQQVHGRRVVNLDDQSLSHERQADASFTRRLKTVCMILTADCLPIVICDSKGEQVLAAHAGWRGIASGIIESSVASFDVPASQLSVWIGPGIGYDHFEIGAEVKSSLGGDETRYCDSVNSGKLLANLSGLAEDRLNALGVTHIQSSEHCTYANDSLFYSYRRDGECGRMATLVWREW